MNVLRVYDPTECGPGGQPLDWERCRTCAGRREIPFTEHDTDPSMRGVAASCPACGGHGSLRAAARAWLRTRGWSSADHINYDRGDDVPARCEDCGHPMSDGTWEADDGGIWTAEQRLGIAHHELVHDREPRLQRVHWSPCGEGCRHDQPVRWTTGPPGSWGYEPPPSPLRPYAPIPVQTALGHGYRVEASWRPVDVRTLGWPHDLRPERLAVLCLRCWAART